MSLANAGTDAFVAWLPARCSQATEHDCSALLSSDAEGREPAFLPTFPGVVINWYKSY